jgi:DNA-binding LacI/PurR family transcriptional regulator
MNPANYRFKNKKITIGLLIDMIIPGYQMSLIEGIKNTLEDFDCNFICFEGRSLNINFGNHLRNNPVFDLAGYENCDGLIISSGNISQIINDEIFGKFCDKYNNIPLVSIGRIIENSPSILIDNKIGIEEMVTHLVEFHGYRKFAVIRGPDHNFDSKERFEAMAESLKRYSIEVDPENMVTGDYRFLSGIEGIKKLLERKSEFDAVIAANDSMAYGIIEELTYQGIHVPGDVAVVGFDNIIYPGTTSPPLTTINQPIYKIASSAAKMILDLIDGKEVPMETKMPTNIIVRETCGCFSHNILNSKITIKNSGRENLEDVLTAGKDRMIASILNNMKNDFNVNAVKISEYLVRIIDSLLEELFRGKRNIFLKTLHYLIHLALYQKEEIMIWEKIVTELRQHVIPHIDDADFMVSVENIFHESRIMISEKIIIGEQNRYFSTILDNELINYFRDEMQEQYDIEKQFEIMTEKFMKLKIKRCFVVLFNKEQNFTDTGYSRLIYAYSGSRLKIDGVYFKSSDLLPGDKIKGDEKYFLVVTSLGYSSEQLGYIIFEFFNLRPENYVNVKRIINNSIQESFFFKKISDQSHRLMSQKEELTKSLADLRRIMGGFIQTMSLTIETRDPYTAGHQRRVSDLARAIATEMNLPHDMIEGIRMAGMIHDLGKIYIPVDILNKPTKLLDIEFDLIKTHSQIAYDILKTIDFPWPIADIVLQHHERLDGSGYPAGLKGDRIRLEACIISVADVVEAMTNYRPYRAALGIEVALDEISKYRNIRYKAEVVDACINLFLKNKFHMK